MKFRVLFLLSFMVASVGNSAIVYASVDALSLEREKVSGIQRFFEVSVKCTDQSGVKLIRKSSKHGAKWCDTKGGLRCSRSKYSLAKGLCSVSLERQAASVGESLGSDERPAVVQVSSAGNQQRQVLLQEQMLIEEQRILIEQRRLELVALELSIKRNHVVAFGIGD